MGITSSFDDVCIPAASYWQTSAQVALEGKSLLSYILIPVVVNPSPSCRRGTYSLSTPALCLVVPAMYCKRLSSWGTARVLINDLDPFFYLKFHYHHHHRFHHHYQ